MMYENLLLSKFIMYAFRGWGDIFNMAFSNIWQRIECYRDQSYLSLIWTDWTLDIHVLFAQGPVITEENKSEKVMKSGTCDDYWDTKKCGTKLFLGG